MASTFRPICLALLAAAWLFASCKKEFALDGIAPHESEVAFPVFSTRLGVAELLPKLLSDTLAGDTLLFMPDGSVAIFYASKIAEKRILDVFKFADTTFAVPLFDTVTIYDDKIAPDSLSIRRAHIKSGRTKFVVAKGASEPTTGRLRVLEMSKNGVPFTLDFAVPANGNFISPEIDLAGYDLNSPDDRLTYVYEAYTPSGQRVKFPDIIPGLPSVAVHSIRINYSYLEGYWGYEEYPLDKARIELDINKLDLQGEVILADPRLTFTVENSFGFPTSGRIKSLRFEGRDGIFRDLTSTNIGPDGAVEYNYPTLAQVGQFVPTTFRFDRTNSNIAAIFNSQPVAVEYEIVGVSNIKKDNSIIGFMTDSSAVQFEVQVELPLEGAVKDFPATSLADLDLSRLDDLDKSKFGDIELKLVAENGLPLGATAQIEFLNQNDVPFDSLFADGPSPLMAAAPVDAQGIATAPSRTETFIPMSIARLEGLKKARRARVRTFFTSSQGGTVPVKVLSSMAATVKMGMKIKVKSD